MGPSPVEFAEKAAELGIHVTISDADWLRKAIEVVGSADHPLNVHVKIDSGMGRIGLRDEQALLDIVEVIEGTPVVRLEGAFTHFACADEEDSSKTEEQFNRFMELVDKFPQRPPLVHASNSAATLLYPEYALDAVRFRHQPLRHRPFGIRWEEIAVRIEESLHDRNGIGVREKA